MRPILNHIQAYWVEWLFAMIIAILGAGYRSISARLKAEMKKNDAIADGMQALLRASIIETYNICRARGEAPLHIKDSIRSVYASYTALGGNDVASRLYNKILDMPEEVDHEAE